MKDSAMPDASPSDRSGEPSDSSSSGSGGSSRNGNLTLEGDRGGVEEGDETEAFLVGTVRTRGLGVKDSHRNGFLTGRNLLTLAMVASLSLALGWFGPLSNKSFELDGMDVSPSTNSSSYVIFNQSKAYTNIYKQRQVANYKRGKGLILNVHITHHAGTTVCHEMGKLGPVPEFACMAPGQNGNGDAPWPEGLSTKFRPEGMNETQYYVGRMRPYFHFVSWEFRGYAHLQTVDWEYPDLVSMIVMRDPLERFLAGGKCGRYHENKKPPYSLKGDPDPSNQDIYWLYANDPCTDNYALRVLAGDPHCVNGTRTSEACLESAKDLLRRFTFILDLACLDDSMKVMAEQLNLTINSFESTHHHKHPDIRSNDIRSRIGNDTLLEFLQDRFRRDIELYEWSKTLAVLQCEEASPTVDESPSDAPSEPDSANEELPPETNATDPDLDVDFEGASLLETSQQRQIASYKNGTALILSIHITHHAGTSVCSFMSHAGPTPEFACMAPKNGNENSPWPEGLTTKYRPEGMNETQYYVGLMRPYFHFVSWEFRGYAHLQTVDWEYPDLVSMIVMRDPLERFLAGGKCGRYHENKKPPYALKGDPDPSNQDIYWLYASEISDCPFDVAFLSVGFFSPHTCGTLPLVLISRRPVHGQLRAQGARGRPPLRERHPHERGVSRVGEGPAEAVHLRARPVVPGGLDGGGGGPSRLGVRRSVRERPAPQARRR
ncbi:hypothetical protein THAOC_21991 [Thalassiosira oceanica]|uniref:Sulfotransferase domain-containing protein n=1 Tax=Thalassiosira oceanica TaxID=159749 RepID=K0RZI5_THAOC|nr:hypothetical protein THAOC_21991 [Thalassiosira oceanica]|eukprot:EJK57924.1 hypothetical protein THAOC_21991 [Thalassiosira oceanica]